MKLGGLSAPCTDAGIYSQLRKADLEKSTIRSVMDLTAPCSFLKTLAKSFPDTYFPLRSPLPPVFPGGGRDSLSFSLELAYTNPMLTSVDE